MKSSLELNTSNLLEYRIGTFCIDVTPPIGHALCGGLVESAAGIRDPLSARGFVITGSDAPVVVVVFDWCELRNDAYHCVRRTIAKTAGTSENRVLVSTVHPHDSPIFDIHAEKLLREHGIVGLLCDLDFFKQCISQVANAVKEAINSTVPLTGISTGTAKVERIASNRRILGTDTKIKAWRGSSVPAHSELMDEAEGLIDPYLKLIIFNSGDKQVAAMNFYATHPMSYYRTSMVSADFYGDARQLLQSEYPDTLYIYANGCGGNIAPGKYNNGTEECRMAMAGRLAEAMHSAWQSAKPVALNSISFHPISIDFSSHIPEGFTTAYFQKEFSRLPVRADREYMERMRTEDSDLFMRFWNAAEALSWLKNLEDNGPVQLSCLDMGSAVIISLPGEAFIQYQLASQDLKPESFTMVMAYGDCGMGYIPVNSSWGEGGYEETASYVKPGIEEALIHSVSDMLSVPNNNYIPTRTRRLSRTYRKWPYKKSFLERGLSVMERLFR